MCICLSVFWCGCTIAVITIVGTDFPAGGALYLDYGKPALGASFIAANCVISSSSLASCLTVPGYGDGLVVRIAMDGTVVNATSPVVFSYLPPFITSVALPASFTTAGGAALAVVIDGENLYGPVSMALGPHREWRMVLQEGNATTFSTNHSRIVASMPAGCGANLPLNVIVGGPLATCAPSAGCNVSYPLPTITSLASQGGSFNGTSLSTLGGQRVIITGGSLGPAHTDFTATTGLVVTASYRDATGVYSYTVQCTKTLAAPHTTAECVTAPGVGAHLVFSVDVCGQRSAEVALSQASYAPPQLFDVTGPGASRASTEGGQLVQLSVADVGPRNAVDSVPQAVVAVRYGTPGVFQYTARSCFVSFASLTGSEITCLTNAGTGAGHYWCVSPHASCRVHSTAHAAHPSSSCSPWLRHTLQVHLRRLPAVRRAAQEHVVRAASTVLLRWPRRGWRQHGGRPADARAAERRQLGCVSGFNDAITVPSCRR